MNALADKVHKQGISHSDMHSIRPLLVNFLFLVTRPHNYVLQFCVKSLLCIATIYKTTHLFTDNNKLCNVLAFVVYMYSL